MSEPEVLQIVGWLRSPTGISWAKKHPSGWPEGEEPVGSPPTPEPLQSTPPEERGRRIAEARGGARETVAVRDPVNTLPEPAGSSQGGTPFYTLGQVDTPDGTRQVLIPVQGTVARGRGSVNVTSLTLDYFDRAEADYLEEMRRRLPPGSEMPNEYPGGIAGFIQDCCVKAFSKVYGMKLAWVEVQPNVS